MTNITTAFLFSSWGLSSRTTQRVRARAGFHGFLVASRSGFWCFCRTRSLPNIGIKTSYSGACVSVALVHFVKGFQHPEEHPEGWIRLKRPKECLRPVESSTGMPFGLRRERQRARRTRNREAPGQNPRENSDQRNSSSRPNQDLKLARLTLNCPRQRTPPRDVARRLPAKKEALHAATVKLCDLIARKVSTCESYSDERTYMAELYSVHLVEFVVCCCQHCRPCWLSTPRAVGRRWWSTA